MAISHILICRTDNIGDVVLTLPLTAYIKQHFPEIKISFLCRAYAAPVVRYCTTVDAVIEMESLSDPAAFFAQSDIDTVIFAQLDKRLAVAAYKARVPVRIGNAYRTWFNWWYCNRPVHFTRGGSDSHEAQLNFKYLRPLGIRHVPKLAEIPAMYHFKIPHEAALDQMLQPYRFNLIFHPKSNGHGREWPSDYFVQLARSLVRQPDIHVWVTGSAAEGQWLAEHASELLQLPNVSNVCGQLTLAQLACFINAADGLIASGTGPLHMSAAFGQRTIGLFPTARSMHPGRWGALGRRAQSLSQTVNCAGCKIKHAMTCECMRSITPEQVEKIVLEWLDQKRNQQQISGSA
ncbi:ADP-heptose:LPS heptosyltransferase [Collimonas sp. PA-H2]|uniref:glycosyltransferase family 9 protein n=1 Tax=Collimonas sp. PA-H2 TaxID=1881062 RepID=UPI000C004E78|nr:glycosyltransferase family 9 protein [Collimonas sp. PA-H2]PFH10912.1 ADP-heptose:LPS heptosyltransferase [Collimonas sp. PA-H2]